MQRLGRPDDVVLLPLALALRDRTSGRRVPPRSRDLALLDVFRVDLHRRTSLFTAFVQPAQRRVHLLESSSGMDRWTYGDGRPIRLLR